jgi:hypothetical protein
MTRYEYLLKLFIKYAMLGLDIYNSISDLVILAEGTDHKGLAKRNWVISTLINKYKDDPKKTELINKYPYVIIATIELLIPRIHK